MFHILLSNNPDNLRAKNPTHTVEAEYGSICVEGTLVTLAHHGERSHNPCPCLGGNIETKEKNVVIGVSHFDLDTLGGVMRILGLKKAQSIFWEVAAEVDIKGVHKLNQILEELNLSREAEVQCREALDAFWAWSEQNRLFPARDGSVTDVTEFFLEASTVLNKILDGDNTLIEEGRVWADKKKELDKSSFVKEENGVVLRRAETFVNHLYREGEIVVAFNEKFRSVTVSLADGNRINCCKLVQKLWGPEAGGHAGIAGSPRGQEMTFEDAIVAFEEIL